MKKQIHLLCSLMLALIFAFTLSGCSEEIKSYDVKVNMWYANYGTVYGARTYNEGEQATISAIPKSSSTFMAWVHNNIVVSYDAEYSFEVNNETSGTYTAVFTCPDLELITPTQIIYSDDIDQTNTITKIDISFSMGNSYEDLQALYSTEIANTNEFNIEDTIMVLNKKTNIICEVNITFTFETTIDDEITTIERTEKTYLEINLQNDILTTKDYSLKLPQGISGSANVKFVFENFTSPNQNNNQENA